MAGEYEVSTVRLSASNAQSSSCSDHDHSRHELSECDGVVQLGGTWVAGVWLGQRRDGHGDRSVEVEKTQDDEDTTEDDHPVTVEDDYKCC